MYKLRYTSHVKKYFKKLKETKLIKVMNDTLDAIEANPYSGSMKTGDLAGIYCMDVFYNKTNYEIAYHIYEEDEPFVIILLAGTRENFYEELKQYMRS